MATRRSTAVLAVVAVLAGVLALLAPPVPLAGAAPTSGATPFSMGSPQASIVDPATGRVFVSGDSKVEVFDADGSHVATVPGLTGASGMDVEGGHLYVAETSSGRSVSRVDIATSTVVDTWDLGAEATGALAVVDGIVWVAVHEDGWQGPYKLYTLDPSDGTITDMGLHWAHRLVEVPGDDGHLVALTAGTGHLRVLDITGPTVAVVATSSDAVWTGAAFDADGDTLLAARWNQEGLYELTYPGLVDGGVGYETPARPIGIATTPADGGLVATIGQSSKRVVLHREGTATPAGELGIQGTALSNTLSLAPDGSRAYVVTGGSARLLEWVETEPAITDVLPGSSVAGVPEVLLVDGVGLGSFEEVTLAGQPAVAERWTTDDLRVTVPTTVAPGVHTLAVTTPLGTATWPFEVLAATGDDLIGTVTGPGGAVAGAEVTLSGGPLGSPLVTTSDGTGGYRFDDLTWSDDYRLEVADPGGDHVTQTVAEIATTPNAVRTLDVVLSPATPPDGPVLADIALPGTPLDIEAHPATGRSFVSAGAEVAVLDADGALIGRVLAQPTAHGLAVVGDDVWVNRTDDRTLAAIDATTLVVGDVHPTGRVTNGELAFAAGRLWFTDGPDSTSRRHPMVSMDPDTGDVVVAGGVADYRNAELRSVEGAPDLLLVYGWSSVDLVDVSGPTPVRLGRQGYNALAVVASAGEERLWSSRGHEWALPSLALTGVTYPAPTSNGDAAYTPAAGGLVSMSSAVFAVGGTAPLASIGFNPMPSAFATDGGRTTLVAGPRDGTSVVVWDLAPHVATVRPTNVVDDVPTPVVLKGANLGGTTAVEVDGVPATFTVEGTDQITIVVPPAVGVGTHPVVVTTPVGQEQASILVKANTGATLTGTVSSPDGALDDVDVEISGGPLGTPVQTTTAVDGSFAVSGLGWGDDYRIEVSDPTGDHVAQVVTPLEVVPNGTTTVDVTLSPTDAGPGPVLADVSLPTTPRDVVVHTASGRALVSAGDEVAILDDQGRLIGRVLGQTDAHGLGLTGDDLYVNQRSEQRVSRIDLTTLDETGAWPTGEATNGQLAFAGGRVWFTRPATSTLLTIAALDPATGTVTHSDASILRGTNPDLVSVTGSPNRLLVRDRSTNNGYLRLLDVASWPPSSIAYESTGATDTLDAVASGLTGRAWTADGRAWDLGTLDPLPTTFPSAGPAVAYTGQHGGVVAFGDQVVRELDATPIATVGDTPVRGALGFTPGGAALHVGTDDARVVTWSLLPNVDQVSPDTLAPGSGPTTVTLQGVGMGGVTAATVDDTPVTARVTGADTVELDLPADLLATGPATLEVDLTSRVGAAPQAATIHVAAPGPDEPTSVALEPGPISAVLSWEPPAGGPEPTGYEVRAEDGRWFSVPVDQRSVVMQPLDAGTPVTFEVRTLGADGNSTWVTSPEATPGPAEALFSDVPVGHRFYAEILAARELGLTGGYPDGTFRPTAPVSRQAAAAFLWRLAGEPTGPFPDPGFTDVPANHTFRDAIWWAADQGITTGYDDDTFRPTAPVTRQAWMTFQWRTAGEPEPGCDDVSFPDVPPTHRFHEPITWAACENITGGYDDGTFRPTTTVSRQAAVAFLVRPLLPTWQPLPAPQ